jgi:hypothetical protein
MPITLRNVISNERTEIAARDGRTVKQAVQEAGFVFGDFSVRDKRGEVVDGRPIRDFEGEVLSVGLPGDTVEGGR